MVNSMNDSKFLKVLYGIICLMLLAFFSFGGYFVVHQVYGAGFMAIGIGLVGLGFAIFLGNGLIFAVDAVDKKVVSSVPKGKAVVSGKALLKAVTYHMSGIVTYGLLKDKNTDIAVSDAGFVVQADGVSPLYVVFDNIEYVEHFDNAFTFVGDFEQDMKLKHDTLKLVIDNKMRCKAFEKTLENADVSFADSAANGAANSNEKKDKSE